MMFIDACCTIGAESDAEPAADALLQEMDRADVGRAVCHPPDRCYAWENEDGNDLVGAACRNHPDRLVAAVTANPWRPDAWDVVERGLAAGGRLLSFSPGIQGFNLSGNRLGTILEKMAAAGAVVPVYVHTGHHSNSTPAQLLLLARRFPEVVFIMGHCGATDYGSDAVPVARQCANIFIESSFARPPGFAAKCRELGPERGIMGSGFPYNDLAFEWSETLRLLPDAYRAAVCGENILKLLGAGS